VYKIGVGKPYQMFSYYYFQINEMMEEVVLPSFNLALVNATEEMERDSDTIIYG
jgi:hypothetical protein